MPQKAAFGPFWDVWEERYVCSLCRPRVQLSWPFISPEPYVVLHQALRCHLLEQNVGSWHTRAVPSP